MSESSSTLINELINSGIVGVLIGSLIAFFGGFFIEFRRELIQKSREENQKIEKIYIENGLDPIISDISRYGATCTTTIIHIMRNLKSREKDLDSFLEAVRQRSTVSDLINFNYELATRAFPSLMVFGNDLEIFNSTINVFTTWSHMTQDLVYYERAKDWLKKSDDVRESSLKGTANISQQMMMYLQGRLIYLSQWIREKKYSDIEKFHRDIKDENIIGPLTEEFKLFLEKWRGWVNSKGADREKQSYEFQKWLDDRQDNIPQL